MLSRLQAEAKQVTDDVLREINGLINTVAEENSGASTPVSPPRTGTSDSSANDANSLSSAPGISSGRNSASISSNHIGAVGKGPDSYLPCRENDLPAPKTVGKSPSPSSNRNMVDGQNPPEMITKQNNQSSGYERSLVVGKGPDSKTLPH